MDASVFIPGPLPCPLERLEDAVEDALQHEGEIVGAGLDARGATLDVRFKSRAFPAERAARLLREALAEFAVGKDGFVAIGDQRFPLT